ncbi:hypothetical protein RhiirC2_794917 [Rhizophagus irregularis]|uniref:Uncharacterized protein n=1 Tax=Rhizophagus irregularis TaxID=588596 RepID=A0A2N1MCN5_9GLOM|nr:hypothetical protein RhiirC2_794917 [Rhizophagus irregularis]
MEKNFITDLAADAEGSNTTPSQQNNTDNFSFSPPKDTAALSNIMDTNDASPPLLDTPTITILRHDYQAAAAPNASSEFVKKYPTNQAMIDAVNNHLLETYHSYTGRAHISSSNDFKRLVIHFNSIKKRDTCFSL